MLVFSLIVSFLTSITELLGQGRMAVVLSYAIINPLLLVLPRLIERTKKGAITREWLKRIERLSFYALLMNAPASLYFHQLGFGYDRFLHFAVGVLAPQIFILLALPFLSSTPSTSHTLTFLALFSFFSLFLWEGIQYSIDQLFGTHLFFDVHQVTRVDFWEDIIFGGIGVTVGVIYAHLRSKDWLALRMNDER